MSTDNMTPSPSDDPIIIKPEESRAASSFTKNHLIQRSALDDVEVFVRKTRAHIQKFKIDIQTCGTQSSHPRIHETILIDGERGTGKTSFLLSAMAYLCSKEDPSRISGDNPNPPYNLGIIDPTLITTKENIFILVLSKIKDAVEKQQETCIQHEFDGKFQEWQDQLRDLARGLCMLDGIGTNALMHDKWEDAQYIMQEGLHNAQSGLHLERNFHLFIQKSLDILRKDCFILCFDDTDTNFSKGWPVLELLRKYFTTPQLIVLFSGDFDLYAKLVRVNQWKLFEDHKFTINHYGEESIQKTIESIESQYITKILPPDRRIILKNAWELLDILYTEDPTSGNTGPIRIEHLFESFTALWYRYPSAVCKKIGDLFAHLPMRNIMQILNIINNAQTKHTITPDARDDIRDKTYAYARKLQKGEHSSTPPSDLPSADAILAVHSNMIVVYYNNLINLGFAPYELNAIQWTGLFYKLGVILRKKKLLKNGASLLPANVMPQDGLDILLLSGIYTSAILADIRLIFDYYIRVLMVRDLLTQNNGNDAPNQNDKKYEFLFSPETSLLDITTGITTICIGDQHNHSTIFGLLVPITHNNKSAIYDLQSFLTNYTTHIHHAGKDTIQYFSPLNAIALLALSVGSNGDFKFEIEKHTHPHTNTPERLHTTSKNSKDNDIKCINDLSIEIHNHSRSYHSEKDLKTTRLLPLYTHHEVWKDFMDGLHKICEVEPSIYKLLQFTYNTFKDAISKNQTKYNDSILDKESLADFISKNPLIAYIDSHASQSTKATKTNRIPRASKQTQSPPTHTS